MQVNEIRIGNLTKQGEIVQIRENSARVEYLFEGILKQSYVNYINLEPIPLTEEILLNCGFELINNEFYRTKNHELNLFWTVNKNKMIPEYTEKRLVTGYDFKHLHQLQNLYFALTGKELEIKL